MFEKFNLRNLKIGPKLLILITIPVLGLLYFAVSGVIERAQVASEAGQVQELVELSVKISAYIHETQKERGRTGTFLGSEGTVFATELPEQRALTDEKRSDLLEFLASFDSSQFGPEFQAQLDTALIELNRLDDHREKVDALAVSGVEGIGFYTNMNAEFVDITAFIPGLSPVAIINNEATAYNLFLAGKELAGIERAILSRVFAADKFEPGEFTQFSILLGGENSLLDLSNQLSDEATQQEFATVLQGEVFEEVDRMRQVAQEKAATGDFGVDSAYWFDTATARINLLKEVDDFIAADITKLAEEVVTEAQNGLILFSVIALVATILTGLIAYVVSRGITSQVGIITELFSNIGIGNFEARAEVTSNDELGEMTDNLNTMLDTILALVQTQEDRDQIQEAIMKLLEEVSGVAEGDLTVEAEVTEDMTGAIADSFNFMIDQLRNIIGNVQDATLQVSSSANEIRTTAEHLSEGSEAQASQIVDTSQAIEDMAASIQQVSENAVVSATVAEQARNNAQRGTVAVQNTIEGMGRIRDQVQETSKRIKRLGESSQEIGEIVQLIGEIADRTSILALNASIQAAMAGEAGRGFAVVAEEVERLAEQATDATKQIEGLVKTIQSETNETVAAMEDSTREVVEGSQLANQAGQALDEIETVSDQLAELIQSISQAAQQQARGSDTVAASMNQIAEVTQGTAAGTRQASVSISNLAVLADDLRGSVSTFKLPSTNGHNGNGHSHN